MTINEASKIATRKQLSFEALDLIYTPVKNGFMRSDGFKVGFRDIFYLSLKNSKAKAIIIGD